MAGNSQRKGAIKKTGKGNPTAGSGGRVRRGLEGKGPTPKATDRPYHKAHKLKNRAERSDAAKPRRGGPAKGGDNEWIAGRNSVLESLRAELPITAVYVAVLGESGRGDPAAYAQAGATWWLENLHDERGSFDNLLTLVGEGPPH